MKLIAVLAAALPPSLGLFWCFAASANSQERYCEEGQVPITWPLGDTGLQPRRLLISHGQFLDLPEDDLGDDWPPFVHRGIDLAACVDEEVFAIEAGWVEDVSFGEVEGYNQVVIADDDEEDVGWSYLHLENVYVAEGDYVERDQAIGTVTAYLRWGGFDHLHLQRVAPSYGDGTSMAEGQIDAGNPLPMLVERADGLSPLVLALDSSFPAVVPFRFRKNDDPSASITPGSLKDTEVDVIACVEEIFPGAGVTACPPILCDGKTIAHQIMPKRISFSIYRTTAAPAGISYPDTVRKRVFHNVIEFDTDFLLEDGPILDVFHPDTVSDYTERKFVVVLTHCQETGTGSFEFDVSGEHLLQVVLEDASANATVREMTIDIP